MDFPGARMDAGRVLLGSATTLALSSAGSAHPVLVVIGPSGSGKSSLVQALAKTGEIAVHPTWTTRPPRADECEGCVEHRFFSEQAFAELERRCFFWATATVFGLPYRYGLPPMAPSTDGRLDVVMLRSPFVPRFRARVPGALVYQVESGPGDAGRRLADRGCSVAEDEARLADNAKEVVAGRAVADRVEHPNTSPQAPRTRSAPVPPSRPSYRHTPRPGHRTRRLARWRPHQRDRRP